MHAAKEKIEITYNQFDSTLEDMILIYQNAEKQILFLSSRKHQFSCS